MEADAASHSRRSCLCSPARSFSLSLSLLRVFSHAPCQVQEELDEHLANVRAAMEPASEPQDEEDEAYGEEDARVDAVEEVDDDE